CFRSPMMPQVFTSHEDVNAVDICHSIFFFLFSVGLSLTHQSPSKKHLIHCSIFTKFYTFISREGRVWLRTSALKCTCLSRSNSETH
ncbi:mCG145535, partial [Mus musculus]